MKEAILVIALSGIFIYCYFLMKKLDIFLSGNRKTIEKEAEKKEPSCVMLTDGLSDEEITAEVVRFRQKHKNTKIFLYDGAVMELPNAKR